ncbi:hypothetical protein FF38_01761 [Lucilia cuprina]|uniref:Uncharacterized protein n=1 Tax=Lucilia cuprina TaxID=7375 RepID=A0A0L0CN67_LUCCU|nr:hypothetical protein FF38_01761 [Lucilia cuprina]
MLFLRWVSRHDIEASVCFCIAGMWNGRRRVCMRLNIPLLTMTCFGGLNGVSICLVDKIFAPLGFSVTAVTGTIGGCTITELLAEESTVSSVTHICGSKLKAARCAVMYFDPMVVYASREAMQGVFYVWFSHSRIQDKQHQSEGSLYAGSRYNVKIVNSVTNL